MGGKFWRQIINLFRKRYKICRSIMMTSDATKQMQIVLQDKEKLIQFNADALFDKLIVKVRHSIEDTPVYTLGLVRDLQGAGAKQHNGVPSITKRKQDLGCIVNNTLAPGWPGVELVKTLTKILYAICTSFINNKNL